MTRNVPEARIVFAPADAAAAAELGDLPGWNLTDLYPSPTAPEFLSDMKKAEADSLAFEARWKGKLDAATEKTGDEGIGAAVREFEALEDLLGRIVSFAGLTYFTNTTDPANGKFYGDVQSKLTDLGAHLLFFSLELNRIADERIDAALNKDALAAHYRPWIEDLRKDKPYQLDDKTEQLFLEKSMTGAAAWNRLFDETMASLRYDIDGEEVPLEIALNQLQSPDGEARRKAAQALAATFKANIRTFTLITNTLAKDKEISDRWRGFSDIADSRHLANRVEPEVVAALAAAVREAYPRLSHRYYAMKAKWLGMEQMQFWDRNAPLPETSDATISWDEARDTVLSAYSAFAPEMADIAKRFFDHGWIDAPVRPGKAPGAFAHPTVPSAHPYVLLNYMGKPRDVMTLAHELGHGVHQVLAAEQGALMCDTPLTLAETASVFGEQLTFRALLAQTSGTERRIMLARKVEDMLNTVVRQTAFYEFERRVHEARAEGELSVEDLDAHWLAVQTESLGDAFSFDDTYRHYWCYISHFIHAPFYVYAYAFGDCLVNALYAAYEAAPDGFAEKYFAMLRAGGTLRHKELLAPFGLDATDPAFWSKGLDLIGRFIDELEQA